MLRRRSQKLVCSHTKLLALQDYVANNTNIKIQHCYSMTLNRVNLLGKWKIFQSNKRKNNQKKKIVGFRRTLEAKKRGSQRVIKYRRCHKGLKPGSASVSLIRPWLLPGLTAREWEEKGWLHTAQSARKPPNGRANAGQVIWRLGCIKAIYKGLKDLRCFTHSVCAFIRPGTRRLSFLSINTKG